MKTALILSAVCVGLTLATINPKDHVRPFPCPKVQAKLLPLEKVPLRIRTEKQNVVIDGTETTINLATAYYLRGLLDDAWDIMGKIVGALLPNDEEVDYFEVIRHEVEKMVGDYIDAHNMDQLEVYKQSLGTLLQRYKDAPKNSSSYADKNTVANSLSTSIITNRFLVEAGERPQSMIIHFADIASIHILVLNDVAKTYSSLTFTSRWWVDLDDQLDHYIKHGKALQNEVVDWRNDMITCSYDESGKYDSWTVNDPVANVIDTCKQLQGTAGCEDHCQAYQVTMNRQVRQFIWQYMGKALQEWEVLKLLSSVMAKKALGSE